VTRPARQRGATLLEALVAAAVLAAGLVALAGVHGAVQAALRVERDQAQSLQAAQAAMERLRATGAGSVAPGETRSAATALPAEPGAAALTVERTLAGDDAARALVWVRVTAAPARGGEAPPGAVLHSAQVRDAAALSAALLLVRGDARAGITGRTATLPLAAREIGPGRSAWRPSPTAPHVFVFDHASGRIVARCTDEADARTCTPVDALSLGGWIRVSLAAPPDPAGAGDAPLPAGVALALTRGTLLEPGCHVEQSSGALAYHCAIAPDDGAWSGRSEITPAGWTVGDAPDQYRVCRYVADTGGNAAHPARYEHVDQPLIEQNFLIVRGGQPCPAAPPAADRPHAIVTAAHQP